MKQLQCCLMLASSLWGGTGGKGKWDGMFKRLPITPPPGESRGRACLRHGIWRQRRTAAPSERSHLIAWAVDACGCMSGFSDACYSPTLRRRRAPACRITHDSRETSTRSAPAVVSLVGLIITSLKGERSARKDCRGALHTSSSFPYTLTEQSL